MPTLKSPAKINIFLEVVNKRKDGYHNIDSVFLAVELVDIIELSFRKDDQIIVKTDAPDIPDGPNNLVYKAIDKLRSLTGIKKGVQVYICKKIPAGGGLGGGSSNAATVIKALCEKWNLNLCNQNIKQLAASLGADIPFFLYGGSIARCRGIGEIVEPLEMDLQQYFILVNPGISINTAGVYGKIKVPQTPNEPNDLLYACSRGDTNKMGKMLFNRLEEAVLGEYTQVGMIKDELRASGVQGVLMSGSGSSVFAVIDNEAEGDRIVHQLREKHPEWFCSLVKAMQRSCSTTSSL